MVTIGVAIDDVDQHKHALDRLETIKADPAGMVELPKGRASRCWLVDGVARAHPMYEGGPSGAVLALRVKTGEVTGVEGGKGGRKLSVTGGGQRVFSEEDCVERDMPKQRRLGDDMRAIGKDDSMGRRRVGLREPIVDVQQGSFREDGI